MRDIGHEPSPSVCVFLLLFMGQIPIFLRNDGLLLTLIDWKLGLLYNVHLIPGSLLFLFFLQSIGDFSHFGGVVADVFHKYGTEAGNSDVLS